MFVTHINRLGMESLCERDAIVFSQVSGDNSPFMRLIDGIRTLKIEENGGDRRYY